MIAADIQRPASALCKAVFIIAKYYYPIYNYILYLILCNYYFFDFYCIVFRSAMPDHQSGAVCFDDTAGFVRE